MEYITITISARTLNTVGAGLQELPYKLAQPALVEIDAQVKKYLEQKESLNVGTKSSQAGNADGDGDGPDRQYIDQGGETRRANS